MVISDKIKPYSMIVKWNNKLAGSGVLVKSKDNKCYLFTARHLFKIQGDRSTTFKEVKEAFIKEELKNISVNKEIFDNDIGVDELLYFREDLDLVVFSLKEEPPIQYLPIVKILKNDHQTQNYYFYGYPDGSNNTGHLIKDSKYIQSNEEEKHVFRLSAENNFDGEDISGYSGSGIFVESKEKIEIDNEVIENSIIYLVGLLIRAEDRLSYYEGVDLSGIIDDINSKVSIEIPTIEDALDVEFTQQIRNRILNRNKEDMFIQQVKKLENKDKTILKDFLESSENELTEMTKKLADFYLLRGMICKDNGFESSEKYFRLATKFNPRYKRYENIIKEQEEINYYHKGIIAFQDKKKYSEAKESFINHLKTENIDSFEKIETHKYLSKIYFEEENYIDAKTHAIEALKEYGENNILEKAELYYQLFKICEKSEKECSLGWIKKGLVYIRENKSEKNKDENLLIIERKLENKEKELEKDDYINKMSPTLVELVQLYPEDYIKEFIDEYLNSKNNEGKNYNTISSKVQELQAYLEEISSGKDEKDNDIEINP
jgi:tetratricopeptide (TPR) repeat protein